MSLSIYQKIQININKILLSLEQPDPKKCLLLFCKSHGFFQFFFFFFFSRYSHYILENCECLGLEYFLIKNHKSISVYQGFHPTSFKGTMPAIRINLPNAMTSGASRAFPVMGHPCDGGLERKIFTKEKGNYSTLLS